MLRNQGREIYNPVNRLPKHNIMEVFFFLKESFKKTGYDKLRLKEKTLPKLPKLFAKVATINQRNWINQSLQLTRNFFTGGNTYMEM